MTSQIWCFRQFWWYQVETSFSCVLCHIVNRSMFQIHILRLTTKQTYLLFQIMLTQIWNKALFHVQKFDTENSIIFSSILDYLHCQKTFHLLCSNHLFLHCLVWISCFTSEFNPCLPVFLSYGSMLYCLTTKNSSVYIIHSYFVSDLEYSS